MELLESRRFLKDFHYRKNVLVRIPRLSLSAWEIAKTSSIIDPGDALYLKLRDVYRGFQLINDNVSLATNSVIYNVLERDKIVNGMMELIERINKWLIPMLNECIDELENRLNFSKEETRKIEEEIEKKKQKLIEIG